MYNIHVLYVCKSYYYFYHWCIYIFYAHIVVALYITSVSLHVCWVHNYINVKVTHTTLF